MVTDTWIWVECWECSGRRFETDSGPSRLCQTCNSDNDDGGQLSFFDLHTRKLVWQQRPVPDWADSYEFDTESGILQLNYRNQESCRYTFDGKLIDAGK